MKKLGQNSPGQTDADDPRSAFDHHRTLLVRAQIRVQVNIDRTIAEVCSATSAKAESSAWLTAL
ncbi:hypothetical protein XI05_10195 [Bradyrhizobium sp. CCBAU 11357]|nr:hypothetical protein [Bradyrhizobium sp. CCBAU 11357]